jgi:catechol 2,3-dioxygenase-like lactoylglutathione lyase family enzyme
MPGMSFLLAPNSGPISPRPNASIIPFQTLRAGDALIDLVDVAGELGQRGGSAPGREGRNMDHLCLRIDPFDSAAIFRHLEDHGVEAGPVERRYGAEGFGPSIYIQDPEGNTVELKGTTA